MTDSYELVICQRCWQATLARLLGFANPVDTLLHTCCMFLPCRIVCMHASFCACFFSILLLFLIVAKWQHYCCRFFSLLFFSFCMLFSYALYIIVCVCDCLVFCILRLYVQLHSWLIFWNSFTHWFMHFIVNMLTFCTCLIFADSWRGSSPFVLFACRFGFLFFACRFPIVFILCSVCHTALLLFVFCFFFLVSCAAFFCKEKRWLHVFSLLMLLLVALFRASARRLIF